MLTPALNSARLAPIRLDRQLDALQCIEAIRLYAAAHEGKLPASLEAITEAPVPLDPATGKPFVYKVDGDSATLSAPVPPGGPDHPVVRDPLRAEAGPVIDPIPGWRTADAPFDPLGRAADRRGADRRIRPPARRPRPSPPSSARRSPPSSIST